MMKQISGQPALKDTPFVLLSSKKPESSEYTSRFLGHLAKPVRRAMLLDALCKIEDPAGAEGALRQEETKTYSDAESQKGGLKILVVEDNPSNLLMVARFLETHGHLVWPATSGKEALEFFKHEPFDAILMDIQMPDFDGFELTERIRELEGTERHVSVIAATAHALVGDRERCLAAGMDDYLAKPLQFNELLSALARTTRQSTAP